MDGALKMLLTYALCFACAFAVRHFIHTGLLAALTLTLAAYLPAPPLPPSSALPASLSLLHTILLGYALTYLDTAYR